MSALTAQLEAEALELRFGDFTLDDAWELGCSMRAAAADADLPNGKAATTITALKQSVQRLLKPTIVKNGKK